MKNFKRVGSLIMIVFLLTTLGFVKPNVSFASSTLQTMTAFELTDNMKLGWNLGNSLDCTNLTWINNPSLSQYETAWGNPVTTKSMVDAIKAAGFNTIRIPVTWDTKMGSAPNYTINSDWMRRVQEVVNYGIDNGMYVILNLHHETNWLIPNSANQATATTRLKSAWTQIATHFQNYDEHLIFETMNEPRVVGDPTEWSGGTSEGRSIVNAYNKAAVDAIRSTGGNNTYRFIMVPTYAASGTSSAINDLVIPNNDPRCIVSLHMYSPYYFAMDAKGTSNWGSDSDKASLDNELNAVYNKFIKNGIAVVIGEWGSINKSNESSRIAHAEYYTKAAKMRQIPLIWWDNNQFTANTEETFGIYNRNSYSWQFPSIVSALLRGVATTTPTPTPTVAPTPTVIPTPTVSPTTTPTPSSGGLSLNTAVNSWDGGYTMSVDIKNTSNTACNSWTLTLKKSEFTISNIWNANMTVSGDSIIITPLDWNGTMGAGETVNFGLQGTGTPLSNFTYTLK